MAEQDASGSRPRRAWTPDAGNDDPTADDPAADERPPARARRGVEPWPEDDHPDDPRSASPGEPHDETTSPPAPVAGAPEWAGVTTAPATAPARKTHLTTDPSTATATPPSLAWGRPGASTSEPRPAVTEHAAPNAHDSAAPDPATPDTATPQWAEPSPRHRLDRRTRIALLTSATALVVVAALTVGFVVLNGRDTEVVATSPDTVSSTPSPSASPEPVLGEAAMLTDAQADTVLPDAGWLIDLDTEGLPEDSPQPTCIERQGEGLPTPEQSRLRTMQTSDESGTAALHQADLYPTAEEAELVYESRLGQLGGCPSQSAWLAQGYTVDGLGEAAGGVQAVRQGSETTTYHQVLLVRTGRVVNVVDVAREEEPVSFDQLSEAAAEVVAEQCEGAGGECPEDPSVASTVPPLGAEQAGFLAGADIPRITPGAGAWGGTPVSSDTSVTTSQCEGFDPGAVEDAEGGAVVTYLLRDDPAAPSSYGFDEVVLTMADEDGAETLLAGFEESVADCPERSQTATVSDPVEVEGEVGETSFRGTTYTVTQAISEDETVSFRIALAVVDNRVVYLILNTDEEFDFSDGAWSRIVERAAERATQGR